MQYIQEQREQKLIQNYPGAIVEKLISLSSAVMVYPRGWYGSRNALSLVWR